MKIIAKFPEQPIIIFFLNICIELFTNYITNIIICAEFKIAIKFIMKEH